MTIKPRFFNYFPILYVLRSINLYKKKPILMKKKLRTLKVPIN